MRALDQGAHFTPNDCRLGLTSPQWRLLTMQLLGVQGKSWGREGRRVQTELEVRG